MGPSSHDSASAHAIDVGNDPARLREAARPSQSSHDFWFGVILAVFAVPLVVAVFTDAALTWDGAYLLFRALDSGVPFIPHDRLIDGPINWPVSWIDSVTDSMAILRATFGVVHVVTPLIALVLSWWVVRKDAPALIIWPLLGIGLATLPGQINFISEGIKANQLIWPILLSVLIGLPARTIPMAAIVSLVIMLLHPAAVPILGAVAAAAIVMGFLQPQNRERLYPTAVCLAIASVLRYGMIIGTPESGDVSFYILKRQWRSSATGLPGISLILTFAVAILLLAIAHIKAIPRLVQLVPPALVAFAGGVLTIWAAQSERWWDALEFRGPTHIVSLMAAGFAVADAFAAVWLRSQQLRILPNIRRRTGQAIAVTFAIVLSVQCVGYGRIIDEMNGALAASESPCLPLSELPDMPESPLNLWSTPSLSLLYQGWQPSKIVLTDEGCERAIEEGVIPLTSPASEYVSDRIDLLPLRWELGGHGECWWEERSGWHGVERTEIGRRRWSPGTGVIRIFVGEPTAMTFRGLITTYRSPNTVEVFVNGQLQQVIEFAASEEAPADRLTLQLDYGENRIEFVSANKPDQPPNDPRDLAISFLNVRPEISNSTESCSLKR